MSKTIMSFKSIKTLLLSFVLFATFSGSAFAATFSDNLGSGFNSVIKNTQIQTDGKIIVNGGFNTFNGKNRNGIVRLNTDGTEDIAFATNIGSGFVERTSRVTTLLSDGKILVGGFFTTFNGKNRSHLIRLNADGTEDITFTANLGNKSSDYISIIQEQADGKILVTGYYPAFNSNDGQHRYFVRLNRDGTEDIAFNSHIGNQFIYGSQIQADGKILVLGDLNGKSHYNDLVRLNTDGTEDTDFHTNIKLSITIQSMKSIYRAIIQQDGKILVAGYSESSNIIEYHLFRLNADGTEDTTFNNFTFDRALYSMKLQSNGKILIGTNSFTANNDKGLLRLNQSGTLDASFTPNLGGGSNRPLFIADIQVQSDGKILVSGDLQTFNGKIINNLIRLNADGTEDTSGGRTPPVRPPRGGPVR